MITQPSTLLLSESASQCTGNNAPEMDLEAQSGRLNSWKEIAVYFNRSVRCVQRWRKNEGLPARHHFHRKGASVYAYVVELEAWWRHDALRAIDLASDRETIAEPLVPRINSVRARSRRGERAVRTPSASASGAQTAGAVGRS